MFFTAKKGKEHKLIVSKDIHNENEFMYPAYQQAANALCEIVTHAKAFNKLDVCRELYGYSQNIIAFSGERGQGKTSTMVSFSKAMSDHDLKDSMFTDCVFRVLPPIDPTVMEETQSILGVILSRMYRMAEDRWSENCGGRGFTLGNPTEAQKNKLLEQFQRCLRGINSVKYRKGSEIKSLIEINEMGDSSLLKQNLYELTNMLLEFVATEARNHHFLVIQLDDTDAQIYAGTEVLEDIRKFLSIPNVVILMATDIDLLRKVVLQDKIKAFEPSLKNDTIDIEKLQKIESKYIDKLIPPTHTIHLPKLSSCAIQYGERMTIGYEDETGKNILLDDQIQETDISAQALILRYIYRKTGIVFAAPSDYYHNIIPTTLRGLTQLLRLLSSMKDVPEPKVSSTITPEELKTHIMERVEILEVNLPLFENYFLNEWIEAKLPGEHTRSIRELANSVPSERLHRSAELLSSVYYDDPPKTYNMTYSDFVSYMYDLEKKHRTAADFYLLFAVRTCISILHHKAALRQMRRAADSRDDGLVIFDFSFQACHLPDTFFIPDRMNISDKCRMVSAQKPKGNDYTDQQRFVMRYLYREYLPRDEQEAAWCESGKETLEKFSFMHLITLALSLGRSKNLNLINSQTSQSWLYKIQMAALTVAANWDVQNKITKRFNHLQKKITGSFMEALGTLLAEADSAMEEINKGSDNVPPMLQRGLRDIINCAYPDKNNVYQQDIALCIADIDWRVGTVYEECVADLHDIIAAAKSVKAGLSVKDKDAEVISRLKAAVDSLIDLCLRFNGKYPKLFLQDPSFDLRTVRIDYLTAPVTPTAFRNTFKKELKRVCQICKIDEQTARKL